ncbi:MAG: efflux RND transporter periplasmic adaptor subunit [Deltaproteobacteria bacterium]|jgi:RND family efflux transporter MFP subunit|nr:efflux RND transporter periplasmic adaptor subunit [Deltaproteobacteria bacterium]
MTDTEAGRGRKGVALLNFAWRHKISSLIVLFLLVLTATRLPGLFSSRPGFSAFGGKEPVYVELSEPYFGTMRNLSRYYGSLTAENSFSLAPKVGGEILEIYRDIGDRLVSGEVVARLDDEEYVLAAERAKLNVSLSEAQLAEAEANHRLAENERKRLENLRGKGMVSQSEYEAAENRQLQALARLDVARSQLDAALNAQADAELRLSYTRVAASWPGGKDSDFRYVGSRLVDSGTLVTANTPIMELVSLDPLLVIVEVLERDYPRIAPGMEAAVSAEAFPGEGFKGKVLRVAPVLSADTRQARVELEVANPGLKLKPGMFAEVVFVFEKKENVWAVSQDVPFRRQDGYVVFVADPATRTVEERAVTLGLTEGGRVELVGTPPIKGPVVVLGQHLLSDGQEYRLPGDSALENVMPAGGGGNPAAVRGRISS